MYSLVIKRLLHPPQLKLHKPLFFESGLVEREYSAVGFEVLLRCGQALATVFDNNPLERYSVEEFQIQTDGIRFAVNLSFSSFADKRAFTGLVQFADVSRFQFQAQLNVQNPRPGSWN
jgi:hypothetical protein